MAGSKMTNNEKMAIMRMWCHGVQVDKTPDGYYSVILRTIYDSQSTRRTIYNTNEDIVVEDAYRMVSESIRKYLYIDFVI